MKLIDLTGKKFGKLTVIKKAKSRNKCSFWLCQCECGNLKEINAKSLRRGLTRSCGCLQQEMYKLGNAHKIHGLSKTRIDNVYFGMKSRCYKPSSKFYKDYGGRGIIICDEWLNDKTKFFNWAINNGYRDDLTIDRIDNNGNYEPNNCRWINHIKQCRNRRSNHYLTFNGETHTLIEWSEITGLTYSSILHRIERGWETDKILTTKRMKNQYR